MSLTPNLLLSPLSVLEGEWVLYVAGRVSCKGWGTEFLLTPKWMAFWGLMRPSKCTLNLKFQVNRIKIEEIMTKKSQRELKVSSPFYNLVQI